MSANPDSMEKSFSERLAEFDSRIKSQEDQDDNASLLNEIHASLTALLSQSGDQDDEIREILQKRYNAGKLRLETYQLVRNVLDRVVIESMATMPDAVDQEETDDSFGSMVITAAPSDQEARQDQLKIGSVLRDRFLLQERVAGGSMGVVYKAHDRRLAEADGFNPWVAIKVLSPKLSRNAYALRALQQEAAKGRCLSHPNIVRFIDLDRDDDVYFIVMEWLEGRSLAAILDENKNKKIDLNTTLDIVRQVGLALDYAHRCGVVHADVKPANVMVTPSGQAKLFDFGIARIRQQQHEGRTSFDPGVLGAITPAYSSMQVLTGEDPAPADDVFSLGCLMYRMVAGHRVFGPKNAAEAAEEGLEPQRPQGLSDGQWRALKKSLAYSRVTRFATPAEFLTALDSDKSERPVRTGQSFEPFELPFDRPIVVEPKMRATERHRYWPGAIVLLALLAAGLALIGQPELLERVRSAGQSLADRTRGALSPEEAPPVADPADSVDTPAAPLSDSEQSPAPAATQDTADNAGAAPGRLPSEPGRAVPGDELTDDKLTDGQLTGDESPGRAGEQPPAAVTRSEPNISPMPDDSYEQPAAVDRSPDRQPGQAPGEGQAEAPAQEPGQAAATDYSAMPPATATVMLAGPGEFASEFNLTLREGADDTVIELVRPADTGNPLSVRLEEVGYSGNRSPLESGRYRISDNGIATFSAGENRSRVRVSVPPNDVRESDVQATLILRNTTNPQADLGIINVNVQDDDQRAFESMLPRNTVGFATNRMYVNESDPAVQIDVLRYNPDSSELEIRYFISGGSALEDDDYFLPGSTGLVFGPGQRSARLLIPLVQDSILESDETFSLEIATGGEASPANISRRIEVIIRDDDR